METLGEDEDPVAFVLSANIHRRHLTKTQRAAAVTACCKWAQTGENQHTRGGEPSAPHTVEQMARTAEVSKRTIQQVKKAQEAGLGEALRDGKVTAKRAAEIADLPESDRMAAVEAPKIPKANRAPKVKPVAENEDGPTCIAPHEQLQEEMVREIAPMKEEIKELSEALDAEKEDNGSMARIRPEDDPHQDLLDEVERLKDQAKTAAARIKELEGQLKDESHYHSRLNALQKKYDALNEKYKALRKLKNQPTDDPGQEVPEPEDSVEAT
jgi:DNA repair exonuclease SbcCD ATPase subunit